MSLSDESLRACGVSYAKARFMKLAAEKLLREPDFLTNISKLSDGEAICELISLKGIGAWSAQIFLLSNLGRENIFPTGDATLERAVRSLYGVCPKNDKVSFERIAEVWSPFKSLAARYFWAWIDDGSAVPLVAR